MADVDVLVIGAGVAGLRTAQRLVDAGLDVVVLEARDRVGGRLEHGELEDGTPLELGGQWIGPTQDAVTAVVGELGLSTFPTYNEGHHLLHVGGRTSRLGNGRNAIPKVNPFALLDVSRGLRRLDRLAQRVPLDAPWTSPDAAALDGRTFESWIDEHLRSRFGRTYLRVAAEALFSVEARELSALHVAFYLRSGTDLDTLLAVDGGAQMHRIVGGSWAIADGMAEGLGDRVRLGRPVRGLRWSDAGRGEVEVTVEAGSASGTGSGDAPPTVVRARRVVVALPPALAGRLTYDPALPSWRDQLTQRVPMGAVIKCFAVYDTPFWRDEGLTGQSIGDRGPVKLTFDNSPPGGRPGVLLAFSEADDARRLARLTADERRREVLAAITRTYGPRAASPIDYVEKDWSAERYSGGCYGGHLAPGVWSAYGHALRAPIGPIHWAGAETATRWNGYLDGAIRSGERAAAEVLAAIG